MASSKPLAAVCQMTSTPDKEANFTTCKRLVEQAKESGASMIFLPEGFDYIGSNREETLHMSESLQGDLICRYTKLARWVNFCLGYVKLNSHSVDVIVIMMIVLVLCYMLKKSTQNKTFL